jgi:acetoin utilization protein AcuB
VTTVGAYMTRAPFTIGAEQSLRAARRLMSGHGVRHLPVLHGGRLVGVLSERELDAFEALPGSSQLTVEEIIAPDAYVTASDAPLDAVAEEMARRRVGSAIVLTNDEVEGVFTTVDAMRALADALRGPAADAR